MNTNWTLQDFLNDVDATQAEMRAKGLVTVYFLHDTLTPDNVRGTWPDHPADQLPTVGQILTLRGMGFYGAPGLWQVKNVTTLPSGTGVEVTMTTPDTPQRRIIDDNGRYLAFVHLPARSERLHPGIAVYSQHPTDGTDWEFAVFDDARKAKAIGAEHFLRVSVPTGSFEAFSQVPDLFAAIGGTNPTTLTALADILTAVGAINETGHW